MWKMLVFVVGEFDDFGAEEVEELTGRHGGGDGGVWVASCMWGSK